MLFIIVTNDEAFIFVKLMLAIISFWFIGGSQDMLSTSIEL